MKNVIRALLFGLTMFAPAIPAQAQTVVAPTVSVSLHTTPGFIDLDDAASATHAGFGVAVSRLARGWLGVEGTVMLTPSAFSGGDLVESSHLLTATGSVLITGPARWRIRPYGSIGIGLAQFESDDIAHLFAISSSKPVASVGTGAWMWLTPRVGIRTGIEFVRSIRDVESAPFETLRFTVGVPVRF